MKPILLLLTNLVWVSLATLHAADRKPNIILIMADDLGWTDTATYGSKYYETPIFPTFLELAAAPKPRQVLDGESLVKLFRDPAAKLQRDAIFQHFPGYLGSGPGLWRTTPVSVIQAGDWKLMEFLEDGKLELYNLRNDIGETKNLAAEMPDKTKELHVRLVAWRKEVNAPMPTKNDGSAATGTSKKKGKRKAN